MGNASHKTQPENQRLHKESGSERVFEKKHKGKKKKKKRKKKKKKKKKKKNPPKGGDRVKIRQRMIKFVGILTIYAAKKSSAIGLKVWEGGQKKKIGKNAIKVWQILHRNLGGQRGKSFGKGTAKGLGALDLR